ncbi:Kazal-type serine protease inhibitor domain-containing protein [Streptomyces sp. T-3]|nr:Kazal-type serine protease inhibitor domain-containing protein [Streptomyces sp. T-3]
MALNRLLASAVLAITVWGAAPAAHAAEPEPPPTPPASIGCPKIYRPVCGADGQTHANACTAAQTGAAVVSEGPCPLIIQPVPEPRPPVGTPVPEPQPPVGKPVPEPHPPTVQRPGCPDRDCTDLTVIMNFG